MEFFYETVNKEAMAHTAFVWAHGWGRSHGDMMPLMQSFERAGGHILVDIPGFGQSPAPNSVWSTEDYADHFAAWIRKAEMPPVIWVGHSYGAKIGMMIAAKHPDVLRGLCVIAGSGLPPKRSLAKTINVKSRILAYKIAKRLVPLGILSQEKLIQTFGAADYKNADGMVRKIFVKIVNEDLTESVQSITTPTLLLYGTNDTETPVSSGERLHQLIPGSVFYALDEQDHYSVLSTGRYQVANHLNAFLDQIKSREQNGS